MTRDAPNRHAPRPRLARSLMALTTLVTLAASGGCQRRAMPPPADPMVDAIRAEEHEAGLTYAESLGKHVFDRYCATCHGDTGKGDGQNASNLHPPPPDLTQSKTMADRNYVRRVIAEGSAAVGRSPLSPPWGRALSAQQIDYVTAYCLALARASTPPSRTPSSPTR
jgi:mono/diheme cytochrome c family protein